MVRNQLSTQLEYGGISQERLLCRNWPSLLNFVDQIRENSQKHFEEAGPLDEAAGPLVLFGAVEVNFHLWRVLEHSGLKASYFCDNNPILKHQRVSGLEVLPPDELPALDGVQVLTAVKWEREMSEQMRSLGIERFFGLQDLRVYEQRWLAQNAAFIGTHAEELAAVFQQLADDHSRLVLLNVLKGRLLVGDSRSALYKMIMQGNQYWALPSFQDMAGAVYVDAGASMGDTIESFIYNNSAGFKKIWAFEPSVDYYRRLEHQINRLSSVFGFDRQRVTCTPKGLARESGPAVGKRIYFDYLGVDGGNFPFEAVDLDSWPFPEPVDIIKADIEGFEEPMLQGAENLIRQWKPKLALCLYHRPEDFFSLPLYLKKLVPEYKMAIRHHSPTYAETVLYCWT